MYFVLILILMLILPATKFLNYYRLRIVPIILVGLFIMFNRGNNDYQAYYDMFYFPGMYAEPGYSFLIKIIKMLGGTDHTYVLIVLGLFWIITFYRYSKYTNMFNFVLLLYVIFPFVLDITQIRNTFLMLFVLNAILSFHKGKKIWAFVLLGIGSTFHSFGLFFIVLFLLLLFKKGKGYYKFVILLSTLGLFLMPYIIKLSIAYIPIQRVVDRIILYTSSSIKISSLIIWGGILVADLFVLNYFIKQVDKESTKNISLIYFLFDVMFSSLIFLGSVMYLFEFNRLFRMLFLIKYLLAALILPRIKLEGKIILFLYLIITTSTFAFLYSIGAGSDGIDYNFVLLRNAIFGY